MANARWLYIKGTLLCCWGAITGSDLRKGIGQRLRRASSLHFGYEAVKTKLGRELDAVHRRSRAISPDRSSTRFPLHPIC